MKKRKLLVSILCAAALLGVSTTTLTGCKKDKDPEPTPEVQKFTVTFDSKGGSSVGKKENVESGSKIAKPTDPTKENFTFGGWYKDSNCTQEWKFGTDTVTSNITLYAKWTPKGETPVEKFTVTFDSDGGSAVAAITNVEKGSKISKPADPTKEGYTFVKWAKADGTTSWNFDTDTVTANITLKAIWQLEESAELVSISVSGGKTEFRVGDTFDIGNLVVTAHYDNGESEDVTTKASITTPSLSEVGKEIVTVSYEGKETTYEITIKRAAIAPATPEAGPDFTDYIPISTVEEFNAFRSLDGIVDKNYYLTADIDLTGVTLEATKVVLTGKFDGNGHTIKNGQYTTNALNKSGLLVRELNHNGSINNVKFQNCSAILGGETISLVAGMVKGTVNISKVEFNSCMVQCNNYAGLCVGRTNSKDAVVTLKEITAKNGVTVTVSSYGGTLIGDISAGTSATDRATVNILDCDLSIELKGANGNGGFLSGRIRNNTNINIKNVILRDAKCPEATGLVCGGGNNNAANSTVTIENLYVMSTNAQILQSCALPDATNPVTTFSISYTNSYISCTAPSDTGTYLTAVEKDKADIYWLRDTLKLDFTKEWTSEEKNLDMYRLTYSTTNAKSPDATISELKLSTANAIVRFETGTEFSYAGLSVTGIYSDGVNLTLTDLDGYLVDASEFKKDIAGTYTITIKSKENEEIVATYTVEVVAQTGFDVDTQFTKLTYVLGEELDLSNLLVYATWSDDKVFATTNYITNASDLDMTTPGAKDLIVEMEGFDAVHIVISVIDTRPTVVDDYIYINVDADATVKYAGEKVNGIETFTTIHDAIDYLVAAKLDDSVTKVMYIADGVYTEKITVPTSLKNLKMIGESRENTKIEYDAVEDTVNPLNGNKYMMDCATLHVNAEGFGLENITINNTFDYINNNTMYANPQGFALTINADGAVINNVTLYGNQDTLFFKKGRVYLKNTMICGNIDFIFGENDGLAFFDQCTIKAINKSKGQESNNGYVTAMKGDAVNGPTYGYIFNDCTFTDDGTLKPGSMSLGRPWGPGAAVAMINCSFTNAYSTLGYDGSSKSRWYEMSGNLPQNAHFCEFGSTGEGAITEAVVGGSILSAEEALNYTAANLFAKTNGGISWAAAFDYATELARLEACALKVEGTEIIVKNGQEIVVDQLTVPLGDLTVLDIFMKEWNASNKNIVPSFEDETVAVWENGVRGLKIGSTVMTLTCGTITKEILIEVVDATPFEVTFVTDGTAVETQLVYKDKKITPVTTTKENAVFKGWFTDDKFENPFNVEEDVITNNTTLYARFVAYEDMAKENVTYYFNGTEGNNVNSFSYDGNNQGKTEEAPALYYGLNIWGAKCSARWTTNIANADTQINVDTFISFVVERFATVKVTYRSNTSATLGIGEDIVTLSSGQELVYFANEAGLVKLSQTAAGYITGITVTYPTVLDATTKINFGSDGNYVDFVGLDQSQATYGQIQTACNQIMSGSILEFYVNPGATIHISGNWSVGYEINGNQVLTSNAGGIDDTGLEYDYYCEAGGKVTIKSLHNNNYFYFISVSYPFMISENTKISFGSAGNSHSVIEGVQINCSNSDHSETDAQLKNGSIILNVKAGANIHISGNWCVDYIINGTVVKAINAGGTDDSVLEYDYQVTEDGEVVIEMGESGSNYFYFIDITFAE